jgi:glucose-1-phosphate cytidylyltransferase
MKVVLFCGGLGTRLRENSDTIPKPLVPIGDRPIIWHLMRYYAHYGHKDFILCLGYRGDLIRQYFLNYNEAMSNDFTLSEGGRRVDLHGTDIEDWKITFVDTGMHSNLGQRLKRVRHYLGEDEVFLANYSDGLSDIPIDVMIDDFRANEAIASFAAVRTAQSFHAAKFDDDNRVTSLGELGDEDFWINGGFFVMSQEIFDYMHEGEELVEQPFARLIDAKKLRAFPLSVIDKETR